MEQKRIYREFSRVGFKIAATDDGRCINLVKYIAYLVDLKNDPPEVKVGRTYEERKEAERARNAAQSAAGRDIGDLPEVFDPDRKEACREDFLKFCESYFREVFHLGWSPDHLKAIRKIEQSVLRGGLFALAMPRGSGKSSLAEVAALWALLYGHKEFVMLVGATETAALEMLDSIKTELEVNETLAEDFPEVVFPIHSLEGIANRCNGQLYKGERTRITWTSNEIVLPTIAGSMASTDEICEVCGRNMVVKIGRFGKFLACPGFPECKNAKPLVERMPGRCPKCGAGMLKKKSKKGYAYYACETGADCGFMSWDVPTAEDCPQCGQTMFKKSGKGRMKPF